MLRSHPLWWEFARTLRIWYIFVMSLGLLLVQLNPTTAECAARYGLAGISITCSSGASTSISTHHNDLCWLPPRTNSSVIESRLPTHNQASGYVYLWKFESSLPMTISFENTDFYSWSQPHFIGLYKCKGSIGCYPTEFVTGSVNGDIPGVFTSEWGFVVQFGARSSWSASVNRVPKFDMRVNVLQNECEMCPTGTYKSTVSNEPCAYCDPGKFGSTRGRTECQYCYFDEATRGFGSTSSSLCLPCSRHSSTQGMVGEICTCNPGSGMQTALIGCRNCKAGTYKPAGNSPCINCVQGKFSATLQATSESVCTNCPENSNSPEASIMADACLCNVGWEGSNDGTCSVCPVGKYKDAPGNAGCVSCVAGKYNTGTGNEACTSCTSNTYSTIIGGNTQSVCQSCPVNSASPLGSDASNDCVCNIEWAGENGGVCTLCEAGKYKTTINPLETKCSDCVAGKFNTGTGNEACTSCTSNTYSTIIGGNTQSVCLSCPVNSASPLGSDASSDCVCNAGWTGENGNACAKCDIGKYKA